MPYMCRPYWDGGVPPAPVLGWPDIPLWNMGMKDDWVPSPRPEGGNVVVDWEPGLPKQLFSKWNKLLKRTKPGDVVYGFDTGVNHAFFDEKVGMIAKKLMVYQVSMSYDGYYHAEEGLDEWHSRILHRAMRLNDIQSMTKVKSTLFISPVEQFDDLVTTDPRALDDDYLDVMLDVARAENLEVCMYMACCTKKASELCDFLSSVVAKKWRILEGKDKVST